MKIIYAHQEIPNNLGQSIFLAGPTPRSDKVRSWRSDAILILEKLGFKGTILIPEPIDGEWKQEYDNQIEWEWKGLEVATIIVFWVPRDLETMPGFTTNIEWGKWYESGKVVLGFPPHTPKMKYFEYCVEKNNIQTKSSLEDTLKLAVTKLS